METDAVEDYLSSLRDLNCNSKPMINALTIIAEENIKLAAQIVQAIENHINKAPADLKLPVLYLIDSIMKNVGRDYVIHFSERIVSIFSSVFEKVDEKTRVLLYKLRQTWTEIIPNKKLFEIDIKVHRMDPAWPITSQAPAKSIHINPKFLAASSKKQEESAKETEAKLRGSQEIVNQLLSKHGKTRKVSEEVKEPEKKTSTNVHKPLVVHVHPSEDIPPERNVTQKLDPRAAQRDPRLQKSGASAVAFKGLPEDKSVKSISPVIKSQQGSSQKHSSLPSVVSVPSSNSSQSREADVSAVSRNDQKSENLSDSSKKKADQSSPDEVKNSTNEQTKSDGSDTVKRFPSPQKLSSEPHLTEIQGKAQSGQDSPHRTRLDASPSKNKSVTAKEKQLNSDSKQPTNIKLSVLEKNKVDIKDSHVETVKQTGKKSKDSPKRSLETEKESENYISKNRSRAVTEDRNASPRQDRNASPRQDRNASPRHRSRSPLHNESKKKDSKPNKVSSRSTRLPPLEKAETEKTENSQEQAVVKNVTPNDLLKADTDLRVSAGSSVSPERSSKSNKRDVSAFRENEDQEGTREPSEPPVKKVKDEKEHTDSENVSWLGSQDQDYRCKERGGKINNHQGWAQYKAVHPDEFKSPLRPARENMENIAPDSENFRDSHNKSLQRNAQPERHLYDHTSPDTDCDRLGRPRLHRRRDRNRYRRGRRYDQFPYDENFRFSRADRDYESMLSDPQFIIRQAEERYRNGVISEDCLKEIRDGIQKMVDGARKYGFKMPSFSISPMYPHKYYEEDEFPGSRARQMNKSHGLVLPPPHVPLRVKGRKPVPPSTCSFELDRVKRDIHFVDDKAIVVIDDVPRQIVLKGQPTQVFVEGMHPITVKFDEKPVGFKIDAKLHTMRFGVPTRELYVDEYPYEGKFGGPPFVVDIDDRPYSVSLGKPIPEVVFLEEPQHELYKKFLAGAGKTESSNARLSPSAEKDIKIEESSNVTKFPSKTEDTDFRAAENEKAVSSSASTSRTAPFDVDMRTVTIKKEPEECERKEDFDGSEYGGIADSRRVCDMKDVDWRHHPSSPVNFASSTRDNSSYTPPPSVDYPVTKDSCGPSGVPPDSVVQPTVSRNQAIKSEVDPNYRIIFTDSSAQAQQNIWNGPTTRDTLTDRTLNNSEKQEWTNIQEKKVVWQEGNPRHSQVPMQPPHDRPQLPVPQIPGVPIWRGGGRFTPPYSQNEPTDCVPAPRAVAPQHPNWRQPLESLHDGVANIPVWDWQLRRYKPEIPVAPPHSHPSEQGIPYSMQPPNEPNMPFENYRGQRPYEQLPPPPLPPRAPLCLMGNQLRPEMPVHMLRPTVPNSDLQNSRPPPPHQRSWLPRNPLGNIPPPPIRERPLLNFPHPLVTMGVPPMNTHLRTTLPPPPLPPNLPNIPVSLQGTIPFGFPKVPSPVASSEMTNIDPVTSKGLVPPYIVPEVQIKSEIMDTSGCEGNVQSVTAGSQQSATQQAANQGNNFSVSLQSTGPPPETEVTASSSSTASSDFVDLSTLLERLIAAGIIPSKPVQTEKMEVAEPDVKTENESAVKEEPTPPIEFTAESLKGRYPGVISALFRGTQCASCGMRFKDTHGERYSRHLDWHFRVNRREKDGAKKAFSRKWYYDVEDWIQFEEFEDFEERARSFFELQADEELLQAPAAVEVPTVSAAHGNETEVCVVCGEAFQLLWVEEEEEWHLKDAVREDGQPYHPLCFEDFKKASEVPETPTDEAPSSETTDTSATDKKQEPENNDQIASAEDIAPKDDVKTEGDAEDAKETDDSLKPESTEETSAVAEEETVKVKEELVEEEPLEGKPGEEEIIGVITESDMEEEERKEPPKESKMVVLQSGGIVMKVRAESIQQPASPAPVAPTDKDADQKKDEESEEEFRPPTPDPRFKVLPPVKKGTELSGLCTIM